MRSILYSLPILLSSAVMVGCGAPSVSTEVSDADKQAETAETLTQAETFSQGWLTLRVTGTGPDVILLPGLSSTSTVWDTTVDALDDRYTLHIADVAGFGGNPAAERRDAVIEGLAGDIAAYIERQNLDAPIIVGHSMGGFTALHVARDLGDRIGGVVSVDSLPFYPLIFNPDATAEAMVPQATMMTEQLRAMPKDQYDASQQQSAAIMSKNNEARVRIIDDAQASDRSTVMDALYELMITDLRSDLGDISVPVTVIYAHDPMMGIPVPRIDQLYSDAYASVDGLTLKRIDGSFHFIMDDQPDAFMAALTAALSQ